MKRLAVVALASALATGGATATGCNFAVKHPAATAGIVAGTVAFGTCELASEDLKNCSLAGGAVGLGLALLAAGALWLGSEDEPAPARDEPAPKVDWDKVPDTTPKEPTKPPPPAPGTEPAPTAPPASPTTPPTPPTTPPTSPMPTSPTTPPTSPTPTPTPTPPTSPTTSPTPTSPTPTSPPPSPST